MSNKTNHAGNFEELRNMMLDSNEAKEAYLEFSKELDLVRQLYSMREHAKLTQKALADKLGITAPAISRLEKSPLSASFKTLQRYAWACGADLQLDINYRPLSNNPKGIYA